ncbi:molybdate ABC transporter substrate-binding protein [Actinokineospora fastidiosa]|uniref:molybdate ABC transporter substrate-binding protein n=1 Tax=Actinokineospora fastidiosa TaxID=1816 RepID=UPI00166F91C2
MRWALGVLLLVTACSPGSGRTVVTVFAAASLTESFTALEKTFESIHPDVDLRVNFAASSALAQQLRTGALADVFASADEATMAKVAPPSSRVFATNRLTIAVPSGNPAQVTGLADLPRVVTVVCAPQVPCGAATTTVLTAAGVTLRPASEEQDVKAVLTKVAADEADAGLVYVTDVRGAAVTAIDFPESTKAINRYPIAVLADAPHPTLAREFVDLVLSPEGQAILADHGFGPPTQATP